LRATSTSLRCPCLSAYLSPGHTWCGLLLCTHQRVPGQPASWVRTAQCTNHLQGLSCCLDLLVHPTSKDTVTTHTARTPHAPQEKLADAWVYTRFLKEASLSSDPVRRMELVGPCADGCWAPRERVVREGERAGRARARSV